MKPASLIDAALDRLKSEIAAITAKIEGLQIRRDALDHAIRTLAEAARAEPEKSAEKRQPPGAVERAIVATLANDRVGVAAESIAALSGHKPASVAAALRRMVATGAVDKVGELYRMHLAEQSEAAE